MASIYPTGRTSRSIRFVVVNYADVAVMGLEVVVEGDQVKASQILTALQVTRDATHGNSEPHSCSYSDLLS